MGVACFEELKGIRLKLCFSALERNMNQSVFFFLTCCIVADVCVVCGFSLLYEDIKGEKKHSAVNREPQQKLSFLWVLDLAALIFYFKLFFTI